MMMVRYVFLIFVVQLLPACATVRQPGLYLPDGNYPEPQWTQEEIAKDIAVRHLYRSHEISTHLMRLRGKEFPHYHDKHDLNVTVLTGKCILHFADRDVVLNPGDVVFIPRGTFHWAENADPQASVAFAAFSPAFDGKDRRKAD